MRRIGIAAALLLLLAAPTGIRAQASYSFEIPEMRVDVFAQSDASIRILYQIEFRNQPGAHPIDIVDVGLPAAGYDLGSVRAWAGRGTELAELRDIRRSSEIEVGVEVHMDQATIAPGESGTLRLEAVQPRMVYQDTTREDYASLRFVPTWYGSQYLVGDTVLTVLFHLGAGIGREEVLHQGVPYHLVGEMDGLTTVVWKDTLRMDRGHLFAVSFPKRVLGEVVEMSSWQLFQLWWDAHPQLKTVLVGLYFLSFTLGFFLLTRGTGGCLWLILCGAQGLLFVAQGTVWVLLAWPLLILGFYFGFKERARRRRRYLPAIASVEGGGIKRGLTAPEAAVLLELPLNKVATLVIFGLIKKKLLAVDSESPLVVRGPDDLKADQPAALRKAVEARGTVLHDYEIPFLKAIGAKDPVRVDQLDLKPALSGLVKSSAERLKGFDLEETRRYYQYIVQRAWREAEKIGALELRQKQVDRDFDWMMLDPQAAGRFRTWGGSGWHYQPSWYRTSGGAAGGGLSAPRSGGAPGAPGFRDVVSSFIGGLEQTAGSISAGLDPKLMPSGPHLNLAGLDKITGQVLKAMASSGGGGRGGGGGCACAGCACACACAGGGR